MTTSRDIIWKPQGGRNSPQVRASTSRYVIDELFFGGARGGGKSDFLLGDYLSDIHQGDAWQGILLRRSYPELDEIIKRTLQLYPKSGGEWKVGAHEWRWPNGARLALRHLDSDADVINYQGHSYAWIGWDELPNWPTGFAYNAMKATLRGTARGKRIRSTGNPGGAGHQWVREYFILPTDHGKKPHLDAETAMWRHFIPSRVQDNKRLLEADPNYVQRLKGVGDPELVAAWLDGDWDAVVGSYFSMFRRSEVEVEPFEIPQGWALFTCMDYGEENPAWCGLLAVDHDDDVWVIDEYYRAGAGGAEHARGVRAMIDTCPFIQGQKPRLNLAPHDMWTKRKPGEATQALAPADSFAKENVHLTRANMERVNGWRNLKDLLYAKRLKFFRGRTDHVCSSLSSVQRDPNDPEDVLKGGDDHPADGLRYGVNHVYRPRRKAPEKPQAPNHGQNVLDLIASMANDRQGRYA